MQEPVLMHVYEKIENFNSYMLLYGSVDVYESATDFLQRLQPALSFDQCFITREKFENQFRI